VSASQTYRERTPNLPRARAKVVIGLRLGLRVGLNTLETYQGIPER